MSSSHRLRRVEEIRRRRCGRCRATFEVCRSCDRGHAYCCAECSGQAREDCVRAARRRHRRSPEGRADHRDRERARRARRRASVGDHGSGAAAAVVLLAAHAETSQGPDHAAVVPRDPRGADALPPRRNAADSDACIRAAPTPIAARLLERQAHARCAFCGRVGVLARDLGYRSRGRPGAPRYRRVRGRGGSG